MWNITKNKSLKLIDENIEYLFYINNTEFLPKTYVFMRLNSVIKYNSGFNFKKNNRVRNVNNYIKYQFKSWINILQILGKYNIDENNIYINRV